MSIVELGALGEFIGSIAVLATLVYLAYQTRQNTKMLAQSRDAQTASMAKANMDLWHNLYGKILESPDTARIFKAVRNGDAVVADEDRERLEAMLVMWVLCMENLLFQSRLNPFVEDIDRVLETVFRQNVSLFMSSPSSRSWWESGRFMFSPEVVRRIDGAMEPRALKETA
jgi:hypothetical protein